MIVNELPLSRAVLGNEGANTLMGRRVVLTAVALAVLIMAGGLPSKAFATDPNFVLTGVVFVEGGNGGRAWLQEPTLTQNQVVPLRPGESIGPYRLTAIQEDRVELQGPAGKVVVFLAGAGAPATPVADTAAPTRRVTRRGRPQSEASVPSGPPTPIPDPPNAMPKFNFSEGLGALLGGQGLDSVLGGGQRKK
jgi:hypothetical protein